MVAVHQFTLPTLENFNGRLVVGVPDASPCQSSSKSVKQLQKYGDFSIFPDGGRLPS